MLITQERESASTSSSSKRIPVNLPETLNKGQEAATTNDNTHRCLAGHTATQTSTMNSCVTNMACLRMAGNKSISPRLRQKYAPSFGPVVSPTSPTTKFMKRALFISSKEDDDNDVFHPATTAHGSSPNNCYNNRNNIIINSNNNSNTSSSLSSSPPAPSSCVTSDGEKQEVLAGRLYLIRQIGNASQSSASPSSPSRSFTKPFNFASIGLSSPPSSPPSQSHNTSPIATKRKLPVYVRVYKCHKDHFALISRDSSYSSRQIYLNMRHCRVFPGDPIGRFIVAGNSDSGSLMEFETPELTSLDSWLEALQTHTIPESPMRSFSSASSGVGGVISGCGGGGVSGCGGAGSKSSSSNNSAGSPSMPTLTEADDEEDRSG